MTDTMIQTMQDYAAAVLRVLLRNRRLKPGAAIVAGDPLGHAEQIILMLKARLGGTDVVHLALSATGG